MILLFIPLMLVAIGGASLVILRDERAVLGTMAVQWLGLVWASAVLADANTPKILGLNTGSAAEFVTATVCTVILGVTVFGPQRTTNPISSGPRPLADYLLAAAAVLLGGVAGVGFALLFPMGGEGGMGGLIFYWTVLASALALVLGGTRSPIKLTVGLFGLLNAVAYLIIILSMTPPSSALLGMMALVRIALATLLAYVWSLFVPLLGVFDLNVLFAGAGSDDLQSIDLPKQLSPGSEPQPPTPDPQEGASDE